MTHADILMLTESFADDAFDMHAHSFSNLILRDIVDAYLAQHAQHLQCDRIIHRLVKALEKKYTSEEIDAIMKGEATK